MIATKDYYLSSVATFDFATLTSPFLDSSGREIRQNDIGMKHFFDSISQNVDYLANDPRVVTAKGLKIYAGSDAAQIPLTSTNRELLAIFKQFAKSHPSTAYLSLGLKDGGYGPRPDDTKLNNYDPRVRRWYRAAIAAPGTTVRTGVYYWAPDDVLLIGTVRTVADDSGSILGVISLDVSL